MTPLTLRAIKSLFVVCLIASSYSEALAQNKNVPGKVIKDTSYKAKPKSAASDKGRAFFVKNKCATCHTIGGSGGCLGPPLDAVGGRRSEKFIKARITGGPHAEEEFADLYGKSELMPHLRIPPAEASAVVQYLLTIPAPKHGFKLVGHNDTTSETIKTGVTAGKTTASEDSIKRGRSLLTSKGCLACHSLGSLGGSFAPKFDSVGSRLTKEAIVKQMKNAELLTLDDDSEYGARGTVMPPLNLSDKEEEDLANFLSSLK